MKKLLATALLACCALTGPVFGSSLLDPNSAKMDKKNVVVAVNDIVILRSFDDSSLGVNNANAYLEAYNKYTGQRVWTVRDVGIIVSYEVIDPYTLVYRNYGRLTAVDVRTGIILWSVNTMGCYSVMAGE